MIEHNLERSTPLVLQPVSFEGHGLFVIPDRPMVWQAQSARFIAQDSASILGPVFSGNKAWKLHSYLAGDFPDVSKVVSYGSVQSNMLPALAALSNERGWQLDYYVDQLPLHLLEQPRGNYGVAIEKGARVIPMPRRAGESLTHCSSEDIRTYLSTEVLSNATDILFINEGGHDPEAEEGMKHWAEEIASCVQNAQLTNPKLMLPSGTGTSAFYLQRFLPFEVLTCPCVGGSSYLVEQFSKLSGDRECDPTILPPLLNEGGDALTYPFGRLSLKLYKLWRALAEDTGITFDLLYDPIGWLHTLAYLSANSNQSDVVYLHQGGVLGNKTMLELVSVSLRQA